MKPPSEDDLKDMFVVLDPPPGGLQRLRARLDATEPAPVRWPWFAAAGLAVAAAVALVLWPGRGPVAVPGPEPARPAAAAPVDLIAGRDLGDLHPAWIGLGRVAPPAEPMLLAPELSGALAARRVPLARQDVVLYLLDSKEQVPEDMPD